MGRTAVSGGNGHRIVANDKRDEFNRKSEIERGQSAGQVVVGLLVALKSVAERRKCGLLLLSPDLGGLTKRSPPMPRRSMNDLFQWS